MRRKCPKCDASLKWPELWRMSGVLRWRSMSPCPRCETPLRRSAMTYLTNVASLGLIVTVVVQYVSPDSRWPPLLSLALAVLMLVGALTTRLEAAPVALGASQE